MASPYGVNALNKARIQFFFLKNCIFYYLRNLIEHRVRRAHRSYIKEKDLLKYLSCLLAFTVTGLTAWTLTAVDSAQVDERTGRSELISVGKMDNTNLSYYVCTIFKWNLAWNGCKNRLKRIVLILCKFSMNFSRISAPIVRMLFELQSKKYSLVRAKTVRCCSFN